MQTAGVSAPTRGNYVRSLRSKCFGARRFVGYGWTKGAFPNDEAVFKMLWLALREASKKWKRPIRDWKSALNQFIILYGDRMPAEP